MREASVDLRQLAAAVLLRAIYDSRQASDPNRRKRAAAWLREGGEDLAFWCAVAGVDVERLRSRLTSGYTTL